jgi:hypothetical protein
MLIGIEGTGMQEADQADLRRSYVLRTLCQSRLRNKFYFIGPNNPGTDGYQIVNGAWFLILKLLRENPGESVNLVGYSRGGAYCISLCENLRINHMGFNNNPVDCLILFDAVARQYFDIPEKIPQNVKQCFHARRDPRTGSRFFFENIGLYPENPRATRFEKHMFFASHGGLGGMPWYSQAEVGNWTGNVVARPDDRQQTTAPEYPLITPAQDEAGSITVGQWMWDKMARAGVVPNASGYIHLAPMTRIPRVGVPLPIP